MATSDFVVASHFGTQHTLNHDQAFCSSPMSSHCQTMSKRGRYNSDRRYSHEWEKDFPWSTKDPGGSQSAFFCKTCRTGLQPKRSTLASHEKTEKHKKRSALLPIEAQPLDKDFPSVSKGKLSAVKELKVRLAVTITCHCSISTIDHLGEVLVSHGQDSFSQIKLHRTKYSKIITQFSAQSLWQVPHLP